MRISDWSSDVCSSDLSSDVAALDVALGKSDYHRDPYAILSRIREVAPVYRSQALNGWLISRFSDVEMVLRDNLRFSAKMFGQMRSEERRVGKEGVSTCRSRWWPDH